MTLPNNQNQYLKLVNKSGDPIGIQAGCVLITSKQKMKKEDYVPIIKYINHYLLNTGPKTMGVDNIFPFYFTGTEKDSSNNEYTIYGIKILFHTDKNKNSRYSIRPATLYEKLDPTGVIEGFSFKYEIYKTHRDNFFNIFCYSLEFEDVYKDLKFIMGHLVSKTN